MLVDKLAYNHADKAVKRDAAGEAVVYAKPVNGKSADSVGVQVVVSDSLGSMPDIEHYNNYSKDGVLNDVIDSKFEPQSVSLVSLDDKSIVSNFDFRTLSKRNIGFGTRGSLSPDWSSIPRKGMTTLSKGEIKDLIRALADKFNNTTCENERRSLQNKAGVLRIYYMSHGSPDISFRKNLFEQAKRTINRHTGGGDGGEGDSSIPRTLLDYLLKSEGQGKGMVFEKPYPMEGGGTVTAVATVGPNSGVAFDVLYQGQHLMSFTVGVPASVCFYMTQQERELFMEINDYWFRAIGNP